MQRPGIFSTNGLDDIPVELKIIEAFVDVRKMQLLPCFIGDIIELLVHENAFVSGIGNGFRESGIVDVVGRSPWKISIMRSGFNDIVLEIVLMDEQQRLLIGQCCKLRKPVPIPFVVLC